MYSLEKILNTSPGPSGVRAMFGYPYFKVSNDGKVVTIPAIGYDNGRVYQYNNKGELIRTLNPSPGPESNNSNFGFFLISDDSEIIAVGAAGYDNNRGRVYLFDNKGELIKTLNPSPGPKSNYAEFGEDIAMSNDGEVIAVGSMDYDNKRGRVYLFDNKGELIKTLNPSPGPGSDGSKFGNSSVVSNDGNFLVVGADGYDNNRGRVYLFDNKGESIKTLNPSPGTESDVSLFGSVIAVSNDGQFITIGARNHDHEKGRVYLYNNKGELINTLNPSSGPGSDGSLFGSAIVISDDSEVIAIGAGGYDNMRGQVYLYNNKGELIKTLNPSPGAESDGSGFGERIFISDDSEVIAVGSMDYDNKRGRVYLYNNKGELIKTLNPSPGAESDGSYFGHMISISDDSEVIAIGAGGYDNMRGQVYLYNNKGELIQTLNPSPGPASLFGSAIDMSDDNEVIAVGASFYDKWRGQVYLFSESDNSGTGAETMAITQDYLINNPTYISTELISQLSKKGIGLDSSDLIFPSINPLSFKVYVNSHFDSIFFTYNDDANTFTISDTANQNGQYYLKSGIIPTETLLFSLEGYDSKGVVLSDPPDPQENMVLRIKGTSLYVANDNDNNNKIVLIDKTSAGFDINKIIFENAPHAHLLEFKFVPIDCLKGTWGTCSSPCGSPGIQTRTGDILPRYGGAPCPLDTRSCNEGPCATIIYTAPAPGPIDCVKGTWGTCSSPCGGPGIQTRTGDIPPLYSGAPCPLDTQTCNEGPCATITYDATGPGGTMATMRMTVAASKVNEVKADLIRRGYRVITVTPFKERAQSDDRVTIEITYDPSVTSPDEIEQQVQQIDSSARIEQTQSIPWYKILVFIIFVVVCIWIIIPRLKGGNKYPYHNNNIPL